MELTRSAIVWRVVSCFSLRHTGSGNMSSGCPEPRTHHPAQDVTIARSQTECTSEHCHRAKARTVLQFQVCIQKAPPPHNS
eukprot:3011965-Rhodomonas_salina.1